MSNRGYGGYNNYNRQQQTNVIQKVIKAIKEGGTLSKVLIPEKYALKDGWADGIARMIGRNMNMNNNQLRKFFTEIKALEDRLDNDQVDFEKAKGSIWLLIPKIAYAAGRKLVDKQFYELTSACLTKDKVKTMEDYKAFVEFYTAIVAYAKLYS